jgi:hypothetical protein
MKNIRYTLLAILWIMGANMVAAQTDWPKNGFVPDAQTAMKIAEAVWLPIYGERIYAQRPYRVTKDGENWVVQGSLPPNVVGGTAVAVIAQKDGRIVNVFHPK